MNTNEIEILLGKFYDGDTSLEEERSLRNYFLGRDVPVHLKGHQSLFIYHHDEQTQNLMDPDFERKLTDLINIHHEPDQTPVFQMHPNRRRFLFIAGVAASVVLLIGLFFTFQNDLSKGSFRTTSNPDAELAYADARGALMMVSGNLNHGLREVDHLQMVDKAMKNMRLLNKFYQYQTIIINPDEILNQSIKSKKP